MSSQHSTEYTRRNSLPSFVRQLLLLMSPAEQNSQSHSEQSNHEEKPTPSSPFEDLYFSFPAYEELEPDNGCESTSSCGHHHHREASSTMKSSRVLC
ncbi:hypothetical protein CLU79DRAFT_742639 [Phycomyces nitens]|nr:hypothetical protein CLU79DRAFT_742639 [Phycomyces nitens]